MYYASIFLNYKSYVCNYQLRKCKEILFYKENLFLKGLRKMVAESIKHLLLWKRYSKGLVIKQNILYLP